MTTDPKTAEQINGPQMGKIEFTSYGSLPTYTENPPSRISELETPASNLRRDLQKAMEENRKFRAALELFCQRRERGEIQSSTTYKQFKQLLERP